MPRTSKSKQQALSTIGFQNPWTVPIQAGDLIPLLSSFDLLYDLKKMFLTDDTVGAMRWTVTTTIRQVKYAHVPQADGEDALDDEEAKKWAKFADSLLVDMKESFPVHAAEIVNVFWAGFIPFEIVLKQRDGKESRYDDGYYGVAKIPVRDPLTVTGWEHNEKQEAVAMRQSGATDVIPMWKLLVYSFGATDANPQGEPLLLTAWRSWRLKIRIQDSEAIGIERDLCGLPVFRYPSELLEQAQEKDSGGAFTPEALAAQAKIQMAITAVKDMRFNRSGGLVMPSDTHADSEPGDRTPKYDFKLVTTAGQRSIDTRTSARDYDRSIARTVMMQFLHLGERSSGSFALSEDQSQMAMKSLQALANVPAEEWNAKVLPLVWSINGFPLKYLPALRAGKVSKEGLTAIGAYLRGVGAAVDLWNGDPNARTNLLDNAGISGDRAAQGTAADAAKKKAEMATQPTLPGLEAPNTGGSE